MDKAATAIDTLAGAIGEPAVSVTIEPWLFVGSAAVARAGGAPTTLNELLRAFG